MALPRPDLINPNKDFIVTPALKDGISSLAFGPQQNLLAATCWDGSTVVMEVLSEPGQLRAVQKAYFSVNGPAMCSSWNTDGTAVFSGGGDKAIQLWDLASGRSMQVAQHDAPIRHCKFMPEVNILATGGWDRSLKYWDLRSSQAVMTVQLPERVYAMDAKKDLLVVGTADNQIHSFKLSQPDRPFKSVVSPMKAQTRCICVLPDADGYIVGSLGGRGVLQFLAPDKRDKIWTGHRKPVQNAPTEVSSIKSIVTHPTRTCFASTGGDGAYYFYDFVHWQRLNLKDTQPAQYAPGVVAPIPCGGFNKDGTIYAYALSYDWSQGHQAFNPQTMPNLICLRRVTEAEVTPRPPSNQNARR